MMIHNANENNIKLEAAIDKKSNLELIHQIHGDEGRYLQILMNFLSNALKFTNKNGSVSIVIDVMDR